MHEFERLGVFYLGKTIDPETRKREDNYMLYDSKDLTTHALCVGMTGSGKTGLCINILEEAAIDGIPALVIDPKGDMTNLLLSFPDLSPEDFTPWVNVEEARKKGMTVEEYGSAQSELWRKGLSEWDQDGQRIRLMQEKADFKIYTPGSVSGNPLSIVKLFSLPAAEILQDTEAVNELASGTAASILGLLGIEADPIRSREHILISNILLTAWGKGEDPDLARLIQLIQAPPFNQIGVMSLESFYPEKERFALALQLNNLLASPGFSAWMQGESLYIDRLLYSDTGKPKISIISIAHLSDAERMFFVSMLLNQVVSWVRSQPGTSSLRALLYMDEIYGYFPPVANPPSKAPLLTLLKQARAFGLGIMLTTQNPMDLDYKGLANMGTWFIGRLQTDRDKDRLLDGLEGAAMASANAFDRKQMSELISSLNSRIFLINNVHEEQPVLFETRWCLSYLRGPLSRKDIQKLSKETASEPDPSYRNRTEPAESAITPTSKINADFSGKYTGAPMLGSVSHKHIPPELPDTITQTYLPYHGSRDNLVYKPNLTALATVHFEDKKNNISTSVETLYMTPITNSLIPVDWSQSEALTLSIDDLETSGAEGAEYLSLPEACMKKASYTSWEKDLVDYLFRNTALKLYRNQHLKKISKPDESERDFKIRLQQESREARDAEIEKLRESYSKKLASLEERIRKAEQAVEREKDQARDARMQTAVSLGTTVLAALLGRKKVSSTSLSRAATTARGLSRQARQGGDVARAMDSLETYRRQLEELDANLQIEIEEISAKLDAKSEDIVTYEIKPLKRDCVVRALSLSWGPMRLESDGTLTKAW
jgi:hypothetical protein